MLLDDIATYLEAQGLGTAEVSLFKIKMPDEPDSCIAVSQYGGITSILAHDGAEIKQPGIQVRVRDKTAQLSLAKIEQAIACLHPKANEQIGGTFFIYLRVNQPPIPLGVDQHNRFEWSVNFSVKIS